MGPPPGGNGFDGAPDLLVGEISTIRTFDLQADGTLWGLMHFGSPWVPGTNTAVCDVHDRAGARGCRCGFWSYGHRSGIAAQRTSRTITGVVDNWGRITPGTRGIRAEHAAIRALYLAPHVSERLAARVAARYPGVPLFRDEDAMLAAHPLTELGVFDTSPVPSPPGSAGSRATVTALLVVALLLTLVGLLGRDAVRTESGPSLIVPVALAMTFAVVRTAGITTWGRRRRSGALRSPARAVARINYVLAMLLVFATFLLPYAPAPTLALCLLLTGGRVLVRRRLAGTVPVRRTPGGLILRAVSPRYRRALRVPGVGMLPA